TQRINNGGNTYETSWSYQHSSSVFGPRSRWSGVRTGAARAGRTESQARPARREAGATCRKQEAKPAAQEEKNTKPEANNAKQENAKPAEKNAAGNRGGRIPADKFKANFGQQHSFRVSQ